MRERGVKCLGESLLAQRKTLRVQMPISASPPALRSRARVAAAQLFCVAPRRAAARRSHRANRRAAMVREANLRPASDEDEYDADERGWGGEDGLALMP